MERRNKSKRCDSTHSFLLSIYLEELSFLTVFALPKASNIGFAARMESAKSRVSSFAVKAVRYCRRIFVASVLPAPLDVSKTIDLFFFFFFLHLPLSRNENGL
jgi:hypothetical protein